MISHPAYQSFIGKYCIPANMLFIIIWWGDYYSQGSVLGQANNRHPLSHSPCPLPCHAPVWSAGTGGRAKHCLYGLPLCHPLPSTNGGSGGRQVAVPLLPLQPLSPPRTPIRPAPWHDNCMNIQWATWLSELALKWLQKTKQKIFIKNIYIPACLWLFAINSKIIIINKF